MSSEASSSSSAAAACSSSTANCPEEIRRLGERIAGLWHHPCTKVYSKEPESGEREWLYISDAKVALDVDHVHAELGVDAVLNVSDAHETDDVENELACVRRIALDDHPELSDYDGKRVLECVELLTLWRDEGKTVLVHCLHGVNRSPAVVVAFHMIAKRVPLAQALEFVQGGRAQAQPNDVYVGVLQRLELRTLGTASLGCQHVGTLIDRQLAALDTKLGAIARIDAERLSASVRERLAEQTRQYAETLRSIRADVDAIGSSDLDDLLEPLERLTALSSDIAQRL
jgi:predicted protein tyrosine phosphatase